MTMHAIDIIGDIVITTGQEEAGFSYRTSVFDMATGEHIMYTIDSDATHDPKQAQDMHARYVEQYSREER